MGHEKSFHVEDQDWYYEGTRTRTQGMIKEGGSAPLSMSYIYELWTYDVLGGEAALGTVLRHSGSGTFGGGS